MDRRLIASMLVRDGDRYLFIRQSESGGAYPGTLHLPGGGVEADEDPREAAAREVFEETGVTVTDVRAVDFDWDTVDYRGGTVRMVFLRFVGVLASGVAQAGSDAVEIVWLREQDLPSQNHNAPSLRFLRHLGLVPPAADAALSVWNPPPAVASPDGRYVAVVGCTGSGKSTLVREIVDRALPPGAAVGIDERDTHHPFLDRLFHAPEDFAFELQLNFMVQRVLIVKRWLATGAHLVMERSHLDDVVFVRHLRAEGYVSPEEHDTYLALWRALETRVPVPDVVVALRVSTEVAVARIDEAERTGLRPSEFGTREQKIAWVDAWRRLYDERITELENDPRYRDRLVVLSDDSDPTDSAAAVVARLPG